LSTSPSLLASFIPLSRNLSSLHCLRNRHWIKSNYPTTGQSRICLLFKSCFMDHLTSNSLLNSNQSAYSKHHSTETALLYIHDHLISAVGSWKVSCLCLLDLSAALNTINHDILITHLSSWFGIHGSVLSWFKSYLSSRCFCVKCETDLSSWYTSSCSVTKAVFLVLYSS